jgi:hypothetical protein
LIQVLYPPEIPPIDGWKAKEQTMITVYHNATQGRADSILHEGFRDCHLGEGTGVLVTEQIAGSDEGPGARSTIEICLDLTAEELEPYAIHRTEWLDARTGRWLEPKDIPPCPREWLIPAEIINNGGRIRLLVEAEDLAHAGTDAPSRGD